MPLTVVPCSGDPARVDPEEMQTMIGTDCNLSIGGGVIMFGHAEECRCFACAAENFEGAN